MLQTDIVQDEMTDAWYKKATVRNTPRILAPVRSSEELVYPPTRSFICDHPIVLAAGEKARSYITTQAAYEFLYNVVMIETKFVIQACLDVLHGDVNGIGDHDKLQTLTIVIDEAYHAHVALDYILQVRRRSGVEPLRVPRSNRKLDAVHRAAAGLAEELRADFQLLAVTIAENVVTEEVANMSREKDLIVSFATLMTDHVRDEGRHSCFFMELMRARWAELPASTRDRLVVLLPDFIDDYLGIDSTRELQRQVLRGCGLSAAEAAQVIDDSQQNFMAEHEASTQKTKSRLFRMFRKIGLLDQASHESLFTQRGWAT